MKRGRKWVVEGEEARGREEDKGRKEEGRVKQIKSGVGGKEEKSKIK